MEDLKIVMIDEYPGLLGHAKIEMTETEYSELMDMFAELNATMNSLNTLIPIVEIDTTTGLFVEFASDNRFLNGIVKRYSEKEIFAKKVGNRITDPEPTNSTIVIAFEEDPEDPEVDDIVEDDDEPQNPKMSWRK